MNSFVKKIFGLTQKSNAVSGQNSSRSFHSSVQGESENAVRAHLVQVVMRDLLRNSGIPPGWVTCMPQVMTSRSRGSGIFVRLSVKHWDDRLMRYAFAFQKALLTDIVRFEPKALSWLHGIAWQLEVASTCPHTVLPDKDFWLEAPAPFDEMHRSNSGLQLVTPMNMTSQLSVPPGESADREAAQDLKRLFAVRDEEMAQHAAGRSLPAGFENTEPSPLRQH